MRVQEFLHESVTGQQIIDKNAINAVLTKMRSGRFVATLTGEEQQALGSLIEETKKKLITLINSNGKLQSDWGQVKQFIDKNKTQILMQRWDTWFKTDLIRQDPKQDKIAILPDSKLGEILVVYPDMYNILQWRFLIDDLAGKILRNTLRKTDADEIIKLKSLLDL
jgi:hypothetical protein